MTSKEIAEKYVGSPYPAGQYEETKAECAAFIDALIQQAVKAEAQACLHVAVKVCNDHAYRHDNFASTINCGPDVCAAIRERLTNAATTEGVK